MAEVLNKTDLQNCFYCEKEVPPTVEIRELEEGLEEEITCRKNGVAFIVNGAVRFMFRGHSEKTVRKGEFIFIPMGGMFRYTILEKTQLTIIRLNGHVKLCGIFPIESLYKQDGKQPGIVPGEIQTLTVNHALRHSLEGLDEIIREGFSCRYYFDIKVQEMLILLKAYYSREQLRGFFALILTPDTMFSEQVRANYHKYATAKELAGAMNMTPKLFSKKFVEIFGEPSISWMRKEKALRVYADLHSGHATIGEIADKYNFSSQSHLNKFCKKEFGKNPGEIRKERRNRS